MMQSRRFFPLLALPLLLICLPLLALSPALSGPFLFDDHSNLDALEAFDNDGVTLDNLRTYLSIKTPGPTGRPLAMFSFLINDTGWPSDAASFKYTNLLIHLINGLLLCWLIFCLLREKQVSGQYQAACWAVLLAALWVLNPYQLSSVMYVIQRMAQLATLFVLSGCIFYVIGRQCLQAGRIIQGYGLIWSGYLVALLFGMLSKENAALYCLLVPLIEWLVFSGQRRPWLLRLTLLLPALLVLAVLGRYFFAADTYGLSRDFTLYERLLSQGRALGYYLWRYLVPGVGYVGVYTDGFEKSHSLLQPLSTLLWWSFHFCLIGTSLVLRRRLPLFSLGVLFFYVAHSMESGPVPLELFYEHRNYLPSVLLFLGLAYLPVQRLSVVLLGVAVCLMAGLQYLQSTYWGDERQLKAVMAVENPTSERAWITYAAYLETQGKMGDALSVLRAYRRENSTGIDLELNLINLACVLGVDQREDVTALLRSTAKYRGKAEPMTSQIAKLAGYVAEGHCNSVMMEHLKQFLDNYVDDFPRMSDALQAQNIARAYIGFHGRDYHYFRSNIEKALRLRSNLELAYSSCSQITVTGGSNHGCECFREFRYMLEDAQSRYNWGAVLLGVDEKQVDDYQREMRNVCSHAEASKAMILKGD